MTIDKSALKALAEAATKGEWRYGPGDGDDENPVVFVDLPQASAVAISILFESDWATDIDAKFVSKANPATILALLAENEALRKIISESATACGAAVSAECSLEFMGHLPSEISSVVGGLRKDAERNNRMLVASCITIGEICEALGIDNHSEPDMIVEAVREMKSGHAECAEFIDSACTDDDAKAVQKDAERYRWLRSMENQTIYTLDARVDDHIECLDMLGEGELDKAIDSEISGPTSA